MDVGRPLTAFAQDAPASTMQDEEAPHARCGPSP
jgi:hypothetical protein